MNLLNHRYLIAELKNADIYLHFSSRLKVVIFKHRDQFTLLLPFFYTFGKVLAKDEILYLNKLF
jgi:hypothetical protein